MPLCRLLGCEVADVRAGAVGEGADRLMSQHPAGGTAEGSHEHLSVCLSHSCDCDWEGPLRYRVQLETDRWAGQDQVHAGQMSWRISNVGS